MLNVFDQRGVSNQNLCQLHKKWSIVLWNKIPVILASLLIQCDNYRLGIGIKYLDSTCKC